MNYRMNGGMLITESESMLSLGSHTMPLLFIEMIEREVETFKSTKRTTEKSHFDQII